MIAFLKSPLGLGFAAALACVALLVGVYLAGHHNGVTAEKTSEAARLKRAKATVAKREDAAKAISTDIATKMEKTRVEIQWRTKTLIEKVPTYVPATADAGCVIPRGFVQLHDAAAAGLPTPSSGPDERPSDVQLSAVASTVVSNYGVAYDWRAEALAWREWYVTQKAAWDKP